MRIFGHVDDQGNIWRRGNAQMLLAGAGPFLEALASQARIQGYRVRFA
jgi:hypothetical protein